MSKITKKEYGEEMEKESSGIVAGHSENKWKRALI